MRTVKPTVHLWKRSLAEGAMRTLIEAGDLERARAIFDLGPPQPFSGEPQPPWDDEFVKVLEPDAAPASA